MSLLEQAEDAIRRHAMLAGGETVLVGVSGGADSVALLHVLTRLAPRWRLTLQALHVDHRLRPDSGRDGEFVTALGRRLGVPVDVVAVTVPGGGSLEAAAREVRHAALERHADRAGAHRIALGHTMDDQAETVLMRLLGGAGVRGLAGIAPVRGRLIRPLLGVRRRQLIDELRAAGYEWLEDPSNRDVRFLRNRIRHEVLPYLAVAVDPGVVAALDRVARLARETVDALERVAEVELDRLAAAGAGSLVLGRAALAELPPAVAAEVLRRAAGRLGSRAPLRAWGHRGLARVLAAGAPPRPFRLGGVTIEVSGDRVRLGRTPPVPLPTRALTVPGRVELPEIGRGLEAAVGDAADVSVAGGPLRALFDADDLPDHLLVRARRPGDRFIPFGAASERRLKSLLIDARVPRWERARVPVVEAGGHIVWVAGVRRGAAAVVRAGTRRVVTLTLVPLADGEARG